MKLMIIFFTKRKYSKYSQLVKILSVQSVTLNTNQTDDFVILSCYFNCRDVACLKELFTSKILIYNKNYLKSWIKCRGFIRG